MTTTAPVAGFDIGRVISRLFGVLGRNFVAFLLLAILLVGLPTAASSFLQLAGTLPAFSGDANAAGVPSSAIALMVLPVSWLIGAMANAVLQGSVIYGAISDLSGRKVTFGEALATGLRFFLPLIGVGLIAAVCCFFGFLIFIVPGVLLALAWSVAAPAVVAERTGVFGAFARSAELTRGSRAPILALGIIAGVVGFIIQMTAGAAVMGGGFLMVSSASAGGPAMVGIVIAQAITNLFTQTFNALIGSAGVASIYYELRFTKEGVAAEQLAAVFD